MQGCIYAKDGPEVSALPDRVLSAVSRVVQLCWLAGTEDPGVMTHTLLLADLPCSCQQVVLQCKVAYRLGLGWGGLLKRVTQCSRPDTPCCWQ